MSLRQGLIIRTILSQNIAYSLHEKVTPPLHLQLLHAFCRILHMLQFMVKTAIICSHRKCVMRVSKQLFPRSYLLHLPIAHCDTLLNLQHFSEPQYLLRGSWCIALCALSLSAVSCVRTAAAAGTRCRDCQETQLVWRSH